jgi:hypothetical protein
MRMDTIASPCPYDAAAYSLSQSVHCVRRANRAGPVAAVIVGIIGVAVTWFGQ